MTIINKIRNANKSCLVCDDKIEGFLPAVPIVCPKVRSAARVLARKGVAEYNQPKQAADAAVRVCPVKEYPGGIWHHFTLAWS